LRKPGHVIPIRSVSGGVLVQANRAEAAVDLLTMAQLSGVGASGRLRAEDGSLLRGAALNHFAEENGLPVVRIADVVAHRETTERFVLPGSTTMLLPTRWGEFETVIYRNAIDDIEHIALSMGETVAAGHAPEGALVRVHSECVTGDNFGSLRCDCGTQLEYAMRLIADEGCGVVIYLRGHEGRGIGILDKLRAYALQDKGLDTLDANLALGLPADARSYSAAAQILRDLGVERLRLMTNNPAKVEAVTAAGLEVVRVIRLPVIRTNHNERYLQTKRDRMGHWIQMDPSPAE
jgi:3,4-dihydroxy 2-butanone 4-phosphate synthase/GTP cyclohydrolase II